MDSKRQRAGLNSFKKKKKRGIAYRENKPGPWCCKCRTSVATAELEDKELPSLFNYLNFRLADGSGTIPIATTRPEFLPACVAIFVNPEDERYKNLVGKKVKVPLFEENEVEEIEESLETPIPKQAWAEYQGRAFERRERENPQEEILETNPPVRNFKMKLSMNSVRAGFVWSKILEEPRFKRRWNPMNR